MASLLELVDALIGDILAGNLYTNTNIYTNALREITNKAHPHTNSNVIPPPAHGPPPMIRGAIYQQGVDRPSIPEQVVSSQQLEPKLPREKIYADSNSLNRKHGPLSDLLDFHDSKVHPHEGKVVPNALPKEYAAAPGYFNKTGLHPAQHGNFPNPPPTPTNFENGSTPLRNWDNVDGTKRNQIYNGTPPPDVISQKGLTSQAATTSTTTPPGRTPNFDSGDRQKGPLQDPINRGNLQGQFHSQRLGSNASGISVLKDDNQSLDRGRLKDNAFSDENFAIGGKYASLSQRPVPPPLKYADIFAVAHWLRNIGKELTGIGEPSAGTGKVEDNIEKAVKGAYFVSSQFLMAALNPGGITSGLSNYGVTNAIWNPLAIPTAAVARVYNPDIAPIVLGPLFGGDYKTSLLDRLKLQSDVMSVLGEKAPDGDLPGLPDSPLGQLPAAVASAVEAITGPIIGPLDAQFPEEGDDSTRPTPIDDDSIYMPFMFEDLRDNPAQYLYFRAFLKNDLTETFIPDWQVDQYYGRVDRIPIYRGTIRSVSVSFDIVAWSPKDLPVIYRKLAKLQSMVYPEYDIQGFLKRGPIIRMRIGDLFAGEGKKGIPGYITALDLSYDDGIWNIEEDFKVPRKISVSLGYTVIHDGNPGIYPYSQQSLAPDGSTSGDSTVTFGAGKFATTNDGVTEVNVSRADIRRIFENVRNKII